MNQKKISIGPVQLLAIGFVPEAKFEGKILKELDKLDRMKTIRVLDLLFVKKDQKTEELIVLSIQKEKMGAILQALMGVDLGQTETKDEEVPVDADNNAFGLSAEQIEEIGQSLEPGMAAGLLLIEHVWARDLKQAVRETGGSPIAEGFLTPEAIAKVLTEIQAVASTMDDMEEAEEQIHTHTRAYN